MRVVFFLLVFTAAACTRPFAVATPAVPAFMMGEFIDDHGERHAISAGAWLQQPRNRHHIVKWDVSRSFLIARNDSVSHAYPSRWTHIDWVPLRDMAPWEWAFCFSAYDAASREAAEAAAIAKPESPRTGCNGHPYTRLRRVTP